MTQAGFKEWVRARGEPFNRAASRQHPLASRPPRYGRIFASAASIRA